MNAIQISKQKTCQGVSRLILAAIFILPSTVFAAIGHQEKPLSGANLVLTPIVPGMSISIEQPKTPAIPVILLAMSDGNTGKITGTINRGKNQCASVPAEYQADCLSQTFKSASRTAGSMVDYVKAGKELSAANKRIDLIVSQNIDKNAPIIRKGGRKLRAVKKSAVASVNKMTKAIIAETETKLLRSAGNSSLRKTHFSRIAKAVGSTKSILRSA